MDFTGLNPLASKPIRGLSKGMRQRLCLGRALIHDPDVLVLDEPAAGLDPRARIELRQMIRALASEGKTILVSSHILTELAEMCDTVGILEQGRLLATGSVAEIRNSLRPSRDLLLRVAGDPQPAEQLLAALACVEKLEQTGSVPATYRFTIQGDDQQQIDVLRALSDARIDVLEYALLEKSLEDVFLQVTQGHIQ
jgi:ABC-2 type transport system ATP-binding protein